MYHRLNAAPGKMGLERRSVLREHGENMPHDLLSVGRDIRESYTASAILHKTPKSPIVAKAIKSIAIIVYLSAIMPNGICTAGANFPTESRCGFF